MTEVVATHADVAAQAEQVLRTGSLSFHLASRLLPKSSRDAIVMLYAWCRHCDDVIDGQALGFGAPSQPSIDDQRRLLADLRQMTTAALVGQPPQDPVFIGLSLVAARHDLPAVYLHDLLDGMQMDVDHRPPVTLDNLLLYCYRVAGTVGLMFAHVAQVSDPRALRHAVDLGLAMQLTNIARDVATDHANQRTYLPLDWLAACGMTPANLMASEHRTALVNVVHLLLERADVMYRSGESGLKYLPWRAAFAAAAARHIYAAIGSKVRRRGADAWPTRVVVPNSQKILLLLCAAWSMVKTVPYRLRHGWQPATLKESWRYS